MKKRSQGRAAHRVATLGILTLSIAGAGGLGTQIFQNVSAEKAAKNSVNEATGTSAPATSAAHSDGDRDLEENENTATTPQPQYVQQHSTGTTTGKSSGS